MGRRKYARAIWSEEGWGGGSILRTSGDGQKRDGEEDGEEEVCARNEYLEKVEDGYELPQAISIAVKLRHGGPLIHQQRPPAAPCHSCVLAILCAYIYVLCYY